MNNIILEYVDEVTLASEIDVLIAITESYQKALTMLDYVDYDDSIIQESFSIYMENDEPSSIKSLFKKIVTFFKNVCSKLGSIVNRCINANKKKFTATYNVLCIIDELNRIFSSKVFNEYVDDAIDADVFQESLFRKKEEWEKEEEELNKRMNKKEKDLEKNVKQHEQEFNKFIRTMRRKFKPDMFTKNLSRKDIQDIVKFICVGASKTELTKLRNAVNDITNDNFENVDKQLFDTLSLLTSTSSALGKYKREFNTRLKENKIITRKHIDAANEKIKDKYEKDYMKSQYDMALLEKFADTFGKELNKLSGTNTFSFENLKAMIYGPNKIHTVPASLVTFTKSALFNMITKAAFALSMFNPKMIIDGIKQCGDDLNKVDDAFAEFAEHDTQLRKEYGIRLNKTMTFLRVGILDNIKEETYRWTDCPFNSMAYGKGNDTALIAGGPITVSVILIGTLLFHKPIEQFFPTAGSLAFLGLCKTLNTGGVTDSGKFSYLT